MTNLYAKQNTPFSTNEMGVGVVLIFHLRYPRLKLFLKYESSKLPRVPKVLPWGCPINDYKFLQVT